MPNENMLSESALKYIEKRMIVSFPPIINEFSQDEIKEINHIAKKLDKLHQSLTNSKTTLCQTS